jgi:4-hydroxybenzoate polyprenyltransferase
LKKSTGYLRLIRPANVITSVADVLAGIAISGVLTDDILKHLPGIVLLCISTAGLYSGGIVANDIFDLDLDRVERPERPIPSGQIGLKEAIALATFLLLGGMMAAGLNNGVSGIIALLIALAALLYDKWSKHHFIAGPLNMGFCRGMNLLLGVSILPFELNEWWFLAFVPVIYIASITMISRGEVHGGRRATLYIASLLYGIVIALILYFAFLKDTTPYALALLLPFAWMVYKPLADAIRLPEGKNIGKAVKAGVLALILMDAAWAAAFGSVGMAVVIVCLLPLALKLGKMYAVT